jgi:hypothetical protein
VMDADGCSLTLRADYTQDYATYGTEYTQCTYLQWLQCARANDVLHGYRPTRRCFHTRFVLVKQFSFTSYMCTYMPPHKHTKANKQTHTQIHSDTSSSIRFLYTLYVNFHTKHVNHTKHVHHHHDTYCNSYCRSFLLLCAAPQRAPSWPNSRKDCLYHVGFWRVCMYAHADTYPCTLKCKCICDLQYILCSLYLSGSMNLASPRERLHV